MKFTNDVTPLAGGLAGLKAERGTALYDSLIFSLFYFNGVKGQRAVLLLSDGKDEGSRFSYEDALDYARRAGVAIYAIGLGEELRQEEARPSSPRRPAAGASSSKDASRARRHLRHDPGGAALAVPDRLPVDQHHGRRASARSS